MSKVICALCKEPMYVDMNDQCFETLLGYYSPPGHDHNDNCKTRYAKCKNGHTRSASIINKCPKCDWVGKKECFCSVKVEEWPVNET